jgi:hypothetical protein
VGRDGGVEGGVRGWAGTLTCHAPRAPTATPGSSPPCRLPSPLPPLGAPADVAAVGVDDARRRRRPPAGREPLARAARAPARVDHQVGLDHLAARELHAAHRAGRAAHACAPKHEPLRGLAVAQRDLWVGREQAARSALQQRARGGVEADRAGRGGGGVGRQEGHARGHDDAGLGVPWGRGAGQGGRGGGKRRGALGGGVRERRGVGFRHGGAEPPPWRRPQGARTSRRTARPRR